MRNNFEKQLATLNNELTNMGKLCEIAIEKATKSLSDGHMVLARDVIQADAEIDQAEKDIERLCLKLLLQQQPVASDLRLVSAALKMITDMERIGDQASDIAEIIISGKICDSVDFPKIVEESNQAVKMVTDSVDAYVNKDLELAGKVEADDDIVDLMFDSIKMQIIVFDQDIGSNIAAGGDTALAVERLKILSNLIYEVKNIVGSCFSVSLEKIISNAVGAADGNMGIGVVNFSRSCGNEVFRLLFQILRRTVGKIGC